MDAGRDLVRFGDIDVLVLECLAERTLALAQQRMAHGQIGYDTLLEARLRSILPEAAARGVTVITNAGAADPRGAGLMAKNVATELGLELDIAVVIGDDVLLVLDRDSPTLEDGRSVREYGELISANAYLGAAPIMTALETGADVVITGRTADASLFLAPILHGLGATLHDRDLVATGLVAGHLLECGAQVSGGYFADGVVKDVPRLADVGFPIAEVFSDGEIVLGKMAGSGGAVTRATVTEQLLYEVLDPFAYLTPDGPVDISSVDISDHGADCVRVRVGRPAGPAPAELKVSVGYAAGYFAEAEISYMGSRSLPSARLATEVLRQRLVAQERVAIEILDGMLDDARGETVPCSRVRVAAHADSRLAAEQVVQEVSALYTNGPAGGSSLRTSVQTTIGIISTLIPADAIVAAARVIRFEDAQVSA